MRRPVVDLAACTLCMGCEAVCPEVFRLNDAGFMGVNDIDVYPEACVQEAIMYCPEDAIYWEED